MEKQQFRKAISPAQNPRRVTGGETGQQSEIRTARPREESSFRNAVDELKEINQSVVLSHRKGGRIILNYLGDSKKPKREESLRQLCEAVGITRSTAYEWIQACRDFEKLLEPVVHKAEETFGKKITKPVRKKLLEVQAANPEASPDEIVEQAKLELLPVAAKTGVTERLTPEETQVFNIFTAIERAQQAVPKNHKKERIEEALAYVAQYVLGGESLGAIEPRKTEGNWILTGHKRGAA